jgi:hypothetical protein
VYFSENGRKLTLNDAGDILFADKPDTGGATGRTQFPSEEARDRAQAEQALAQAELARAQAANLPKNSHSLSATA